MNYEERELALDELKRVASITESRSDRPFLREKVEVNVRWALELERLSRIGLWAEKHKLTIESALLWADTDSDLNRYRNAIDERPKDSDVE